MNIRVSFAIKIITSMTLFLIVGQSLFAQDQRQQNLEAQLFVTITTVKRTYIVSYSVTTWYLLQ